jgi:Ca-activated chloride channel family protein
LENSGIASAKQLATNGVVVFTIGVGTPAGKEIQVQNAAGQMELLHDARGEVVRSQLDEKTLLEIAQATGGSYFPLGRLGDGLMQVKSAMHSLDTASATRSSGRRGMDRFYVPLAVLVLLLAAEPLIGTRKRKVSAT